MQLSECPVCLADRLENALIELNHWQEIATEYRASLHLCEAHHPAKWEDDGTCPICEGHRLKEALENIIEHVCDSECDDGCSWIGVAKKAIAKAGGR